MTLILLMCLMLHLTDKKKHKIIERHFNKSSLKFKVFIWARAWFRSMVHRPTLQSRPFWLVGVYNSVNSYIFIWGNLSNGEIFLQTFRRLFQFRETKGELKIDYFIRKYDKTFHFQKVHFVVSRRRIVKNDGNESQWIIIFN